VSRVCDLAALTRRRLAGSSATLAGRVARDTVLAVVGMSVGALVARPDDLRLALGVVGGGTLIGISFWAIRGGVEGLLPGAGRVAAGRRGGVWLLVKTFTRHAILAAAAYGMMVRLRLDPVGMLVGVSAIVVAALAETVRSGIGPRGVS